MKNFLTTYHLLRTFALASILVFTSCDKDDEPVTATNTVEQILKETADFSLFKEAVSITGLESFINGSGPFTFLVPENAAFNAIGINAPADLSAMDRNTLAIMLTYHIIPGRRMSVEVPIGPNAPITTQSGLSVYASKSGGNMYFNGTMISEADIVASNGVIHRASRILWPPRSNALNTLNQNPDYSLFVQAITKAAVTSTFTGTTVYTVFAPNNAAMVAAGYDSTAIANTAAGDLSPIVRYHAVKNRLFSSEFKTDSLVSAQGAKFFLDKSGATAKVIGKSNAAYADVFVTDIVASNAVIHAINGVLNP